MLRPSLGEGLTPPQAARLRQLTALPANWTAVLRSVAAGRHRGRLERLQKAIYGIAHRPPPLEVALARSAHLPRLRTVSRGWRHAYPGQTKSELPRRFPAIGRKSK